MKLVPIFAITVFFLFFSSSYTFADYSFPTNFKNDIKYYALGKISDERFIQSMESFLSNHDVLSKLDLIGDSSSIIPLDDFIQERNGWHVDEDQKNKLPKWVKDRAMWITAGTLSDEHFLKVISHLKNTGYLHVDEFELFIQPEQNSMSLIPQREDINSLTGENVWSVLDKQKDFKTDMEILDSSKVIFRDISRVFEPTKYKYKIPTIEIDIVEFSKFTSVEKRFEILDIDSKILENSQYSSTILGENFLTGDLNDMINCNFNQNNQGGFTICHYDSYVVKVMFYDPYSEYFEYSNASHSPQTEPSFLIAELILNKISEQSHTDNLIELASNLKSNISNSVTEKITDEPQFNKVEKSNGETIKIFGIEQFSCQKDDFGFLTLSGIFNNDSIPKDSIQVKISFLDESKNTVSFSKLQLNDLHEFESKRFFGMTKPNFDFLYCNAEITN